MFQPLSLECDIVEQDATLRFPSLGSDGNFSVKFRVYVSIW
jgi:hypothetical protein